MTTWSSGYVADVDYTYGYFRQQSPALLSLVLLNKAVEGNGARAPRYLELGFGQGLSLAIHAAACNGEFWGTDFHPAHAAHARALVEAAGSAAQIFDQSFAEFAARDDLPEFDVITLHGIWSWIAPEHRATIVDLARRKLAVGGILYMSYNAMPGCAPLQPMQHLMGLHARLASAPGSSQSRKVGAAMAFTRAVIDSGAQYFQLNPIVSARFDAVAAMDPNYLAHEYFTTNWQPMAFSDVQAMLDDAKLTFVGSTLLADHIDALHLQPENLTLLNQIENPTLRESVRDVMINTQFRTDVYVRGGRALTGQQRFAGYLARRFVLTTLPEDVPMTLKTIAGELVFDESIYRPLLAALANDEHAPKTLAMLIAAPGLQDKSWESLIQAILVLNNEGHVHPAQPEDAVESARARCLALNGSVLRRAVFKEQIGYLASPVMGAGFKVPWIEQLFLLARDCGVSAHEWPHFVQGTVKAAEKQLWNDGKPVTDANQSLAEMAAMVEQFQAKRLPILQALGIV